MAEQKDKERGEARAGGAAHHRHTPSPAGAGRLLRTGGNHQTGKPPRDDHCGTPVTAFSSMFISG